MPAHFKSHRAHTVDTSADGGRYARIDHFIDDDGPVGANPQSNEAVGAAGIAPAVNSHGVSMSKHLHEKGHKSTRKHFFIGGRSAIGGSGLHQGHKKED